MSALWLQFVGGGGEVGRGYLASEQTWREFLSEPWFGKAYSALRITKRNWGTSASTYSQRYIYVCKMPCYLRIEPTHTDSDGGGWVKFKTIFAGREGIRKEKWAHTTTTQYSSTIVSLADACVWILFVGKSRIVL